MCTAASEWRCATMGACCSSDSVAKPTDVTVDVKPEPPQAGTVHLDLPSQLTSKYTVDPALLGEGGFAKVHLATRISDGKSVAIKIIDKAKVMKQKNGKQYLEREVSIMQSLEHENIIHMFEAIDATAEMFLVMEVATGGELFDVILERGTLSEVRRKACAP